VRHVGAPKFNHDCKRCRFLGQTIGGGKLHDLYVCERIGSDDREMSPSLIARYGDEGREYYSIDANYAHATGHAELFAAAWLWRVSEEDNEH
jgi:hypothetical protein